MGGGIDRRDALALGGAALLAPAAASARYDQAVMRHPAVRSRFAEARAIASQAYGQQLIALEGDPVRLWRDRLAVAPGPIGGITSWSDYIILRGLAAERGLRIRNEEHVPMPGRPMLVRWTAA